MIDLTQGHMSSRVSSSASLCRIAIAAGLLLTQFFRQQLTEALWCAGSPTWWWIFHGLAGMRWLCPRAEEDQLWPGAGLI